MTEATINTVFVKAGTPNLNKALSQLQGELPRITKTKTGKVEGENKAGKYFSYEYCVSPETRILMHDLRWVEAHKLAEGDSLVAFDEMPATGIRCRRWRSAEVQAVKWVTQPTYRIHLADGTELVASATHRWLVMSNSQFMTWADTKDLRTPDRVQGPSHLVRAVDMWPETLSYESGYLAAAFDGEGCLVQTPVKRADGLAPREQTYQLHCTFAQRDNEMKRQVDALLAHFGFSVQHRRPNGTNSDVYSLRIAGGRPEVLRFLGQVRPVRLLSRFTADHLGAFRGHERVAISAIEFLGEQPLIAAQTSTRTFIAEGFASHNSYADLGDVVADVGPLLAKYGLAFHCGPTINPADRREMILIWSLLHESGEEKTGEWPLGPVSQKPQSLGSAITYGRRYCFTAATNIVLEDDDDGQRAQQDHGQPPVGG